MLVLSVLPSYSSCLLGLKSISHVFPKLPVFGGPALRFDSHFYC